MCNISHADVHRDVHTSCIGMREGVELLGQVIILALFTRHPFKDIVTAYIPTHSSLGNSIVFIGLILTPLISFLPAGWGEWVERGKGGLSKTRASSGRVSTKTRKLTKSSGAMACSSNEDAKQTKRKKVMAINEATSGWGQTETEKVAKWGCASCIDVSAEKLREQVGPCFMSA